MTLLSLLIALLVPGLAMAAPDAKLTGSYLDYLRLSSEPASPRTGYLRAYIAADGKLYGKNSAGVVAELGGAGGGTQFTVAGPLAYDELTKILSMPAATAIADGYMTKEKFAQVGNHETRIQTLESAPAIPQINAAAPLTYNSTNGNLGIPAATTTSDGYMPKEAQTKIAEFTAGFQQVDTRFDTANGRIDARQVGPLVGDITTPAANAPNATITAGAVNTAKLADGAATEAKIADDSVSLSKMKTASVSADKLAVGAVDLATSKVTGVAPIVKGGTGAGTKQAAFNALSPAATKGSTIVSDGTNNVEQAGPAPGQVLVGDISTATGLKSSDFAEARTLRNITFYYAPSSGQLRVGVSGLDSLDHSLTNVGKVAFRSANQQPIVNVRTITSALAYTFPAGATLGRSTSDQDLYGYLIDVGDGTVAMGASAKILDESKLQPVVQGSASSLDNATLYSSAPSGTYPIRLVGRFKVAASATPATWTSVGADFGPASAANTTAAAVINPFVTEWKTFAMTIGGTTPPTKSATPLVDSAQWRRVGPDSIEVRYDYAHNVAGAAGAGTYTFPLPPGFTIDTNKQQLSANGQYAVGYGWAGNSADVTVSSNSPISVHAGANNYVFLSWPNGAGANAWVGATTGYGLNSNAVRINFRYTVPVTQYANAQAATIIDGNPVKSAAQNLTLTRVTAFSSPCKPGEYRSYNRNANAYTYTEAAPATAPTAADGFRINAVNFGTAGSMNRIEQCIGPEKVVDTVVYQAAGRSNVVDGKHFFYGTDTETGVITGYDKKSGIAYVDAGANANPVSSRSLGYYQTPGGGVTPTPTGYVDFFYYDNPMAAGFTPAKNEVVGYGGNGNGSTNTKFRRFSTTQT